MELPLAVYVTAFGLPLVLAWYLTPLMLKLALRMQALDRPGERKSQQQAVPYLGGVAIVIAFAATVLSGAVVTEGSGQLDQLAAVLGAGVVLALVGLVDDLRGLGPFIRLVLEAAAGMVVYLAEPDLAIAGPEWLGALLVVVWVVGITNAFNLLDNMDGLSAGVATIAGVSFFAIAIVNGQYLLAALSIAVAGCAAGFLRHNFHPAKIYMGDAGSLFLGFMLAAIAVRLQLSDAPASVSLFVPVLVLGVAMFDTTLVTLARLRHGRSPLSGGRDHVSHRLVWVGIPVPVSVGLIYALAASLGFLGLLLARLDETSGLMLVGFVLTVGVAALALLYTVPVYDNSRQRQAMLKVVRQHEPEPPAGAAQGDLSEAPEPREGLG